MRIGVIGSGSVGQHLAAGLQELGHDVMIGTREPGRLAEWRSAHPGVQVGSNADAAGHGEVVILATSWAGTHAALELAGTDNLRGKVLVDVTNPLDFGSGKPELAQGAVPSAAELIQGWVPGAHVVKALNTLPAEGMLHPTTYFAELPSAFIAGDDQGARQTVRGLLESAGWPVVDVGELAMARHLESLALLWIRYGFDSGWTKRAHAFKLIDP